MFSVFVSQEIYLASLGGDGKVKDNVYRMMFAVMTNEVGRTFNWSGKPRVEGGCRHEESKVPRHNFGCSGDANRDSVASRHPKFPHPEEPVQSSPTLKFHRTRT